MAERKEKREDILAHLSIAILATTGNITDFSSSKILLVRNKDGKWGPPAGKIDIQKGIPEHPVKAAGREWGEETGNEPFDFEDGISLIDTVFTTKDQHTMIGFIFEGTLTEKAVEIFGNGKEILDDEDIVFAKLASVDDLLEILKDWRNKLTHPEINAQTLIRFCNIVLANRNSLCFPGIKESFKSEDFDIDFPTTLLSLSSDL